METTWLLPEQTNLQCHISEHLEQAASTQVNAKQLHNCQGHDTVSSRSPPSPAEHFSLLLQLPFPPGHVSVFKLVP